MTTILAYDASGSGLRIQSGTFYASESPDIQVTYSEERYWDYNTSVLYIEYNHNEISVDMWVDYLYGTTYKITDVFFYDSYGDAIWDIYDFNIVFDATDDFSDGVLFSNMLSGADRVTGNSFADRLWLGTGNDFGNGRGGSDRIFGEGGNDSLQGGSGADTLDGGTGNDTLLGQAGNDSLNAGSGLDRLVGGIGRDLLYGGADGSRDIFDFNYRNESSVGSSRDVIYNFTRTVDDIDLRTIDARASTAANEAFLFKGSTATAYSVWYSASGSNVIVKGDVTGDRVADFEILVSGVTSLNSGDFIL